MDAKKNLLQEDASQSTYLDDDYYDRLIEISNNWTNVGQACIPVELLCSYSSHQP